MILQWTVVVDHDKSRWTTTMAKIVGLRRNRICECGGAAAMILWHGMLWS